MAKFRVGERARLRMGLECPPDLQKDLGKECTVLDWNRNYWWGLYDRKVGPGPLYEILVDGNADSTLVVEWGLEKLVGSWDEIEHLTGYRPGKPKAKPAQPIKQPETVE